MFTQLSHEFCFSEIPCGVFHILTLKPSKSWDGLKWVCSLLHAVLTWFPFNALVLVDEFDTFCDSNYFIFSLTFTLIPWNQNTFVQVKTEKDMLMLFHFPDVMHEFCCTILVSNKMKGSFRLVLTRQRICSTMLHFLNNFLISLV